MSTIIVKTQTEWDALPPSFPEFTVIEVRSGENFWLQINKVPESSSAELWGSSRAVLRGSSSAELWGSSRAVLRESSSAELWESSSAELWESSRAVLRESSSAVLWESSSAELRESSSAELWESSSAELWESSRAVLWESSRAVLRGSSSAELWGSSRAVLRGSSSGHIHSPDCSLTLWAFAVAICLVKVKIKIVRKSKTCTVVNVPPPKWTTSGWLGREGVTVEKKMVVLFKRVSALFQTQEKTKNETNWPIGQDVVHGEWSPKSQECGPGKFHACGRPYICDNYRDKEGDRYVAIRIAVVDLYAWPNPSHPHKIAFRKGTVLFECNRFGDRL